MLCGQGFSPHCLQLGPRSFHFYSDTPNERRQKCLE